MIIVLKSVLNNISFITEKILMNNIELMLNNIIYVYFHLISVPFIFKKFESRYLIHLISVIVIFN